MEGREVNKNEMSLATVLGILQKRRWLILLVTFGLIAYGYGSVKFGKKSYEAKAVILLNFSEKSAAGLSLGGLSGGPSPLKILTGVLKSREAEKRIVAKTKLSPKEIRDFLVINEEASENQVSISMNFSPNEKALEVVKASVEVLGEMDREIGFSTASKLAKNLEQEIARRTQDLTRAESNLVAFQKQMKYSEGNVRDSLTDDAEGKKQAARSVAEVMSYKQRLIQSQFRLKLVQKKLEELRGFADKSNKLGEKLPVAIPEVLTWKQELAKAEMELRSARISFAEESPEVVRLRQQVMQLKQQVKDAVSKYVQSVQSGLDPAVASLESEKVILEWEIQELAPLAEKAPAESLNFRKLSEEVATLQQVIRALRTRYEAAKTEAEVDPVKWSLLDEPSLDVLPSNFRPVRTAGLMGLSGFLGICFVLIAIEALGGKRKN